MLGLKLDLKRRKDENNNKLEIFNSVMKENFEEIKSVLPKVFLHNEDNGSVSIRVKVVIGGDNDRWSSFQLVEFEKPVPPSSRTQYGKLLYSYKQLLERELKKEVLRYCK